jgi:pilus assembly protein CpaE
MSEFEVVAVGAPPTFRQTVARALERDAQDIEWMPTVSAAEGFLAQKPGVIQVLVLSPVVKEADAYGLADFVARTTPSTAVVMVRDRALNGMLPAAMRAGVRDVVDLSQGSQELREALRRALAWSANLRSPGEAPYKPSGAKGVVISVFSSKGGTGKTFLASNLAVALAARSGLDTALVDFDLEMGDVLSYFGKDTKRAVEDFMAVGRMADPEAIRETGNKVDDHLWIYAAQTLPGNVSVAGEAGGKVLTALRDVFPFIVVDASANYSDHALAAFDLSDVICLIAGLDVVGVRHLTSALRNLTTLGLPRERFRIVLNRADSKVGLAVSEVERVTKLKVDVLIPSSRQVPVSLNLGHPIYASNPRSEVAKAIGELADRFMASFPVFAETGSSADAQFAAQPRKRGLFRRG